VNFDIGTVKIFRRFIENQRASIRNQRESIRNSYESRIENRDIVNFEIEHREF
jgi:hypothetical protein